MTLSTQVQLLRVLESSTFRRVGGTREVRVDVRVVAATNRDLAALIDRGHFRGDLFYRLNTLRLELLPLRQRREDVLPLVEHFLGRMNARFGTSKALTPEAAALVEAHPWPGNVRELAHVLEQAHIVSDAVIEPVHLPATLRAPPGTAAAAPTADDPASLPSLLDLEKAHVERVLRAVGGHRGQAARILGISERNLYRKLHEHGLA